MKAHVAGPGPRPILPRPARTPVAPRDWQLWTSANLLAGAPLSTAQARPRFLMREVTVVRTTKQITVFLENKPGRLANVLSALAREKVNLTALSVMDRHEHSVLRLVSDDPAEAVRMMQSLNTPFTETEVLLVELRNQPGALAHVCEVLAAEHIAIDYAYCSSGGKNGKVFGIFKVSNAEKASRVLSDGANNVKGRRVEPRPVRDQRTYTKR
jgi:hypothetical protein